MRKVIEASISDFSRDKDKYKIAVSFDNLSMKESEKLANEISEYMSYNVSGISKEARVTLHTASVKQEKRKKMYRVSLLMQMDSSYPDKNCVDFFNNILLKKYHIKCSDMHSSISRSSCFFKYVTLFVEVPYV